MMRGGTVRLLIWVSSAFCLMFGSLGYDPIDNFLIDCGSSTNQTVGNRVFLPDESYSTVLSSPQKLIAKTTLNSSSIPSSIDPAVFETALIFPEGSRYTFPIKKQGRHWVRLYFHPFVHNSYIMSQAKFSVSAQSFTLLKDFQIEGDFLMKEYILNVTSSSLVLTFTPSSNSFAFVNALEIVLLPDELIPKGARAIGLKETEQSLSKLALETVWRVNMGNVTVSSLNDTLGRFWDSDYWYLNNEGAARYVSKPEAVEFSASPTKYIAPSSVYGTATMLKTTNEPRMVANLTWNFDVDPGFKYLVRFHFCDMTSNATEKVMFKVFINDLYASDSLDLKNLTSNFLGRPYFMDVITRASDIPKMNVSVGPYSPDGGYLYPITILNGLEIMKISNSRSSLDVSLRNSSKIKLGVIVGLAVGVFFAIVLAIVLFLFYRRRLAHAIHLKAEDVMENAEEGKDANGTVMFSASKIGYRFPLAAIQEATENFSENLLIGVGGFGKVYKGILKDHTKVAVKRGAPQSKQGIAEFRTEIEMLSQFRHRHLVSLIGYCDEKDELIIIYEYMENGSLKSHLYGSDHPCLSWRKRLEICVGAAKGLHYLHTSSEKTIIHRDVKSANILLDGNLMAKVADFGLSKNGPETDQTHVSTAVKGSFGYLDPEYLTRQQLTEKSDVYSFGVVMFEILCGRPAIDPSLPREEVSLVEYATKRHQNGQLEEIVDPRLAGQVKPDTLRKYGDVAAKCLSECGVDRPTVGDVLWNLEFVLQLEGNQGRSNHASPVNNLETSTVSTVELSMGSLRDIAGVSMSKVFAQMVREDMR
ncbi:probable receptor-like protein kinase At5g59700 [Argentina anserina]|uniref:probable receptor-like protein kinase At5g59700 n=1 Tax=Argentina anserina TaxID=57926 RepID=UPI00217633D2|nr:probable receptor-like protein kinase At5g59700 [Potentilla anserina]